MPEFDTTSNIVAPRANSALVPGILDRRHQGPDVDHIVAAHKTNITTELTRRIEEKALLQIK